jgi:hypothetical protein
MMRGRMISEPELKQRWRRRSGIGAEILGAEKYQRGNETDLLPTECTEYTEGGWDEQRMRSFRIPAEAGTTKRALGG